MHAQAGQSLHRVRQPLQRAVPTECSQSTLQYNLQMFNIVTLDISSWVLQSEYFNQEMSILPTACLWPAAAHSRLPQQVRV